MQLLAAMDVDALYARHRDALLVFLVRRTADTEVALDLWAETFAQAVASPPPLPRHDRGRGRGLAVHDRQAPARALLPPRQGRAAGAAASSASSARPPTTQLIAGDRGSAPASRTSAASSATRSRSSRDRVRDAVQLRIVDELPYADVARSLRISEPAARARVSRGLAALADFLDPRHQGGDRHMNLDAYMDDFGRDLKPRGRPRRRAAAPRSLLAVPAAAALAAVGVVALPRGDGIDAIAEARAGARPERRDRPHGRQVQRSPSGTAQLVDAETEQWYAADPDALAHRASSSRAAAERDRRGRRWSRSAPNADRMPHLRPAQRDVVTIFRGVKLRSAAGAAGPCGGGDPATTLRKQLAKGDVRDDGVDRRRHDGDGMGAASLPGPETRRGGSMIASTRSCRVSASSDLLRADPLRRLRSCSARRGTRSTWTVITGLDQSKSPRRPAARPSASFYGHLLGLTSREPPLKPRRVERRQQLHVGVDDFSPPRRHRTVTTISTRRPRSSRGAVQGRDFPRFYSEDPGATGSSSCRRAPPQAAR